MMPDPSATGRGAPASSMPSAARRESVPATEREPHRLVDDWPEAHRPDPKRVQSRNRVDCSCGWRGVFASTFGECMVPWREHFYAAVGKGATHGWR